MSEILIKILMGILTKFATDVFVSRLLVYGLRAAADKSGNKLAEEVVDAVADALGVVEKGRIKAVS